MCSEIFSNIRNSCKKPHQDLFCFVFWFVILVCYFEIVEKALSMFYMRVLWKKNGVLVLIYWNNDTLYKQMWLAGLEDVTWLHFLLLCPKNFKRQDNCFLLVCLLIEWYLVDSYYVLYLGVIIGHRTVWCV